MNDGPKLTAAGKLFVLALIAAALFGAYRLFQSRRIPGLPALSASATGDGVELGIAYGTEKERWLKWAAEAFAQERAGRNVRLNLIPMGSVEGAQAVLNGDARIQVWSPASALYKDVFVQDWQAKHGKAPLLKEEALALSPMVFVMWEERHAAFVKSLGPVTFKSVSKALAEKGGWKAIAARPEWGFFKFGHTHPNRSNSGLMTLFLAACDFHGKSRGLALGDVVDVGFQTWLGDLERGVTGLPNSTGNLMKEMVLKGPSAFDVIFVYENVAIDFLKNAEGRWGKLRLVYPSRNMWNDNPYYILDVPWSSPAQRKAGEAFLAFLMSERVQKEALTHGFRPGNPAVPIKFPESPFVQFAPYGVTVDLGDIAEAPSAEVIQNLLVGWQRSQGAR